MDLNEVTLDGRLTRDPELSYTAKGTPVMTFYIANNYFVKTDIGWNQETNFIQVKAFGKVTEKYNLIKGQPVRIQGELRTNNWTDQEGNRHYQTYVLLRKIIQ